MAASTHCLPGLERERPFLPSFLLSSLRPTRKKRRRNCPGRRPPPLVLVQYLIGHCHLLFRGVRCMHRGSGSYLFQSILDSDRASGRPGGFRNKINAGSFVRRISEQSAVGRPPSLFRPLVRSLSQGGLFALNCPAQITQHKLLTTISRCLG